MRITKEIKERLSELLKEGHYYIGYKWINSEHQDKLLENLHQLHIDVPNGKLGPDAIFSFENAFTFKGFSILLLGGFLIGFGTPYAGGCTSGHAISGLSNLQIPSLIAVIGFFLGGLISAHFLIPLIFGS